MDHCDTYIDSVRKEFMKTATRIKIIAIDSEKLKEISKKFPELSLKMMEIGSTAKDIASLPSTYIQFKQDINTIRRREKKWRY